MPCQTIDHSIICMISTELLRISGRVIKRGSKYLHCAGGELHTYSSLGVCVKLSCAKSTQEVGFSHSGVADDHQLEEVVVPARPPLECRPISCDGAFLHAQASATDQNMGPACEGGSLIVVGVLNLLSHLKSSGAPFPKSGSGLHHYRRGV